jgi:hypothetical protein
MVAHAVARREAFRAAPVNCYPGIEQPMWAEFDQAMAAFFDAHIAPAFGAVQALGLNTRMSIVTLKPEQLLPQQRICHRDARECTGRGRGGVGAVFVRGRAHGRHQLLPAAPASAGNRPPAAPGAPHGQRRLQPRAGRPPQYYNGDERYFEKLGTAPAKWNRAIFYDATIFHTGQIDAPELLAKIQRKGASPSTPSSATARSQPSFPRRRESIRRTWACGLWFPPARERQG